MTVTTAAAASGSVVRGAADPADALPTVATIQLCVFRVGTDDMVVDIMRVREIMRPVPVTPVPQAPPGVRGILHVRGAVMPLIDLRVRFGLPAATDARSGRIMVVLDRRKLWGLLVDSVEQVARVPRDALRPGGQVFAGQAAQAFSGVVDHRGRLLLMLNVGRLLATDHERDPRRAAPEPGHAQGEP